MAFTVSSTWLTIAIAAVSAYTTISLYLLRRKWGNLKSKVRELGAELESVTEKCAAERKGRIKAQQTLRKALAQPKFDDEMTFYPMTPIGTVQSCFATRNGTPRQPLIVPLARACLVFHPARVPPASLEGLEEYSHCWILYVFHLNTDLDKLWKKPSQSKFKAKVRVPRLKGGRMGVFATRSPHRPCPIGLTVARVEAVKGQMILLSGVDLVDGTPVLDIKPYLPYCDSIQGATVPQWVMEDNLLTVGSISFSDAFSSTLAECWPQNEKISLYASVDGFKRLITQVLSWDIRSVSQRHRPHRSLVTNETGRVLTSDTSDLDNHESDEISSDGNSQLPSGNLIYHLILEGLDISYRIDSESNVIVEKATPSGNRRRNCYNYLMWKDVLQ